MKIEKMIEGVIVKQDKNILIFRAFTGKNQDIIIDLHKRVTLAIYKKQRSLDSNSFFHCFLGWVANELEIEFDYFREIFLNSVMGKHEIWLKNKSVIVRDSTKKLTQLEFDNLIMKLDDYVINELEIDTKPFWDKYEKYYKGTGRQKKC